MHWSAKKLIDWYCTLRRADPALEGSAKIESEGFPEEPPLAIQEEKIRSAKIDPETFDFFYVHYYHRILSFCYGRTLHRDTAEDLTSETFAKALDNIGKYRWSGVSIGAWLYRIAANEIKGHYRTRARRPESEIPTNILGEDLLVGSEPSPERRLELAQERARLAEYASRLSLDEQNYLHLRFREDLLIKEIAAIAGKPIGSIAARIHRSLVKMQKMAEEEEDTKESHESC